jgi:hypothetical protein
MIIKKAELGKNKNNSLLDNKKIFTFDTETFREVVNDNGLYEKQYLAYFSIYDGEEYYNGLTKNEFLNYVKSFLKAHKKIILFAHNLSYDLTALDLMLDIIKEKKFLGVKAKRLMTSSVIYYLFQSRKFQIELIDTFNFFKTSLKNMAKDIGADKVYKEDDYSLSAEEWTEKLKNEIDNKDFSGANQDAKILYDYIISMSSNKNILWSFSSASSSFRTWKNLFNPVDIDLTQFNDIALKSYKGGRNEIYRLGNFKNVIDVDINSLYPYVMLKNKYSYKFKEELKGDELNSEYVLKLVNDDNYNYFLNIDYSANECERLPLMVRVSDKLIQVDEAANEWITGREFKALYECGAKIKINRCLKFYHADLFSDYVKYFYALKQNSQGSQRTFYKLMLNSLYGKLAQHRTHEKIIFYDDTTFDYVGGKYNDLRSALRERLKEASLYNQTSNEKIHRKKGLDGTNYEIYPDFFVYSEKNKASKYPILIAAEITANARLLNYERQKELGFNNVIYTDTDSFFINLDVPEEERKKINAVLKKYMGDEIGQWKIENAGSFRGYAPKNYEFIDDKGNNLRKLKGVKKNAKIINEDLYEQEIIKSFKNKYSAHLNIVEKVVKKDKKTDNKFIWTNNISKRYKNKDEYEQMKKLKINK